MKGLFIPAAAVLCVLMILMPSFAEESAPKEKILNKTDSSVTLIDEMGRTVVVKLPVKNVISTDYRQMEALLAIGAGDMIVGVDSNFHKQMPYFGLKDAKEVGLHAQEVNYEQVLLLNPDLVIVPTRQGATADEIAGKLKGVPVVVFGLASRDHIIPEVEIMGQILRKENGSEKLTRWIKKYDTIVDERTKGLKESETPTFYYEYMSDLKKKWWAIAPANPSAGRASEGCGGRNIAADLKLNESTTTVEVEPEWLLSKNTDYIFMDFMGGDLSGPGNTTDDLKGTLSRLIDERSKEGFGNFSAVKNNHTYIINRDFISGPRWVIGHICFAKWLHPDLFKDLDPEEINKEYLKEFHGLELKGAWVYPAP